MGFIIAVLHAYCRADQPFAALARAYLAALTQTVETLGSWIGEASRQQTGIDAQGEAAVLQGRDVREQA